MLYPIVAKKTKIILTDIPISNTHASFHVTFWQAQSYLSIMWWIILCHVWIASIYLYWLAEFETTDTICRPSYSYWSDCIGLMSCRTWLILVYFVHVPHLVRNEWTKILEDGDIHACNAWRKQICLLFLRFYLYWSYHIVPMWYRR